MGMGKSVRCWRTEESPYLVKQTAFIVLVLVMMGDVNCLCGFSLGAKVSQFRW